MNSKIVLLVCAAGMAVGGWFWRNHNTANVTIKAFRDDATIEMAEVSGRSGVAESWKSFQPGEARLAKAPWMFRLSYGGKVHTGLVVVDGDGLLVLK